METRQVTQIKIYSLRLNHMANTSKKIPNVVAIAYELEPLKQWVKDNKVEEYKDGRFIKYFKKGTRLEMFNLAQNDDHGYFEEWIVDTVLNSYRVNHPEIPLIEG
jgi:hypothetical protein